MAKAQPFTFIESLPHGADLRLYPAHTLISVDIRGDFGTAGVRGFGPLISYISGSNSTAQKIAMTAPVVQAPRGGEDHTISFVLPEGMSPGDAPVPEDSRVTVHEEGPRHVAALRFSGSWNTRRAMEETAKLSDILQVQGLTPVGEPFYGRFDPPWVPGLLRHNEVLIPVAAPSH